jgi:hypothetical protein
MTAVYAGSLQDDVVFLSQHPLSEGQHGFALHGEAAVVLH